jgi:hypothetical protein
MATTGLYDKYAEKAGKADVDLVNHRIVAALLDLTPGYVVDLAADEFLSELPALTVVASLVMTGKSVATKGAFSADASTFPNVATGTSVGALLIYRDTGFENSSPLIHYDDAAAGLPIVGDGDNVAIQWPSPIFKLKA